MNSSPDSEQDWCERCGQYWPPESQMPCRVCWDGRPEPEIFERIVAAATDLSASREALDARAAAPPESATADERRQGQQRWSDARDARSFLAGMSDPALGPRLAELALAHPEEGIRAACATSLGWLAMPEYLPVLERLLNDESSTVRREALFSLADSGGSDALVRHMVDAPDGDERLLAALGLAWLEDRRGFAVVREAAQAELLAGGPTYDRTATWGFVRLAARGELVQMADVLKDQAARELTEDLTRGADALLGAVHPMRPNDLDAVIESLADIAAPVQRPSRSSTESAPPRTAGVPRRAIVAWHDTPPKGEATRPRTKRGGQPDWRSAPTWPVDDGGRPFQFAGQFDLGEQDGRTAYVFFDEWNEEEDEPLGSSNAVVVQPGPLPGHVQCVPEATGPRPYTTMHMHGFRIAQPYTRPTERWAEEVDGFDPESWDDDGTDADHTGPRVGGTPWWRQYPDSPPGDGWHFAFQFSDDFFDYFGFVDDDGRGALLTHC